MKRLSPAEQKRMIAVLASAVVGVVRMLATTDHEALEAQYRCGLMSTKFGIDEWFEPVKADGTP